MKSKVKVEIKPVKPLKTSLFTKKPQKSYCAKVTEFTQGLSASPPSYVPSLLPSVIFNPLDGQQYLFMWQKALRIAEKAHKRHFQDTARMRLIYRNKNLILTLLHTPVYLSHTHARLLVGNSSTELVILRRCGILYWFPKLGWHLHPLFLDSNPLIPYLSHATQVFNNYLDTINTSDEIL